MTLRIYPRSQSTYSDLANARSVVTEIVLTVGYLIRSSNAYVFL